MLEEQNHGSMDSLANPSCSFSPMMRTPSPLQSQTSPSTEQPELCFFIRDDDFVKITPKFVRLEQIAHPKQPIMMAIIPARLNVTKEDILRISKKFVVSQHGYSHDNHGTDEQRTEFPESRGRDVAEADLRAGKKIIKDLFGEQAGQDFVTPWNRFHDGYYNLIAETGYRTFHTIGPVSIQRGVPVIGSCINFTSVFRQSSNYGDIWKHCLERINLYALQITSAFPVSRIYVPINTHHLMMDDRQFDDLGRLCADLELKEGIRFAGADEALDCLGELSALASAHQ